MFDFMLSLEGFFAFLSGISVIWGLIQKYKASKARRSQAEMRVEADKQRKQLLQEIQDLAQAREEEVGQLMEKMDAATTVARDELATLRGQLAKLMDMVLSGDPIQVDADGEDVTITGSSGNVVMKERTLNKVVEATQKMKYKRGMGGGLKKVTL